MYFAANSRICNWTPDYGISNASHNVSQAFQPRDPRRFEAALCRFDEENSLDPNVERVDGADHPRELIYSQWLTDWVLKLSQNATEELRLAARSQHLCRWTIPRDSYPTTRAGYLKWREDLKKFHANKAGEILRELGYSEEVVTRVQNLNLKKNFPRDPETGILEDALCLVFLERQFTALASKTSDDKMINALRKAWGKMTPQAREDALKLSYGVREKTLLQQALAEEK